jgi:hypothetical protein
MLALFDKPIGATKIGSHATSNCLRMKCFGRAVSQHRKGFKRDFVFVADLVLIFGRKVPIDAALYSVAFGSDLYGLGYLDHAIGHDGEDRERHNQN